MELSCKRILITLENKDRYMIQKNHNDDMYEIEDNHLFKLDSELKEFFVFKRWKDVKIDLGKIVDMEIVANDE